MKNKFFTATTALMLLCALLLTLVLTFTACDVTDNESNTSASPNTSTSQESEPEVSGSVGSNEVSYPSHENVTLGVVIEGDAYTQEQLDEWVEEYIAKYKNVPCAYDETGKYNVIIFPEERGIVEDHFADLYLNDEKLTEYEKLFWGTEAYNLAELLEYYGISWDEYIGFYVGNEYDRMMCLGKHADNLGTKNVKDGKPPYAVCPQYFNDGWAKEEFWNHEDFIVDGYVPGEYEDYYTSVPDRGNYMRRAYIIDGKLIEHIGLEAFNEWLDETEDKDQTIWNFVEHFGLSDVRSSGGWWKYKSYGLTEEERELYYTVHPLN